MFRLFYIRSNEYDTISNSTAPLGDPPADDPMLQALVQGMDN